MPIAWALSAMVVLGLAVAVVGGMGMSSESAGTSAAYMAAGPVGFVCAGAAGAAIVHFAVKAGAARVWAPFGCGCLGGLGLAIGVWVFFAAIFPAL